jgi:hypothetical protein
LLGYNPTMIAKLTKEQIDALHASSDQELQVIDPDTQKAYVLVEREKHDRAMDALRRQQDREAIAEGISQMEAGLGKPLDQAMNDIRARLGFPQAQ